MIKLKKFKRTLGVVFFLLAFNAAADLDTEGSVETPVFSRVALPERYSFIRDQLVHYREGDFKVYYGGPVTHSEGGITWTMPVVFENEDSRPRSSYEVSFINCTPESARGARIVYIDASDIDIKFKNSLNKSYKIFNKLIHGRYSLKSTSYVLIRRNDIAMVAYPDIYVEGLHPGTTNRYVEDVTRIAAFLGNRYSALSTIEMVETPRERSRLSVKSETAQLIEFHSIPIRTRIDSEELSFQIRPFFLKNDAWGVYYVIVPRSEIDRDLPVLVRVDSGCMSGQIYGDDSCDCSDQLHSFLKLMAAEGSNGISIHIPLHDGRGFGSAPKAETEIYKMGGRGRMDTVAPMDTVAAARHLYQDPSGLYDIRTYDGAGYILKMMGCRSLILHTDNRKKFESLESEGLEVVRQGTETHKASCAHHIQAKKNDPLYFDK